MVNIAEKANFELAGQEEVCVPSLFPPDLFKSRPLHPHLSSRLCPCSLPGESAAAAGVRTVGTEGMEGVN